MGQAPAAPRTIALFLEPKPRQLQSAACDACGPAPRGDEIEIAGRIGLRQVDGRRQQAAIDRERRRREAAAPLAPCGCPTIDLVDEPGDRRRARAEQTLHARDLDRVVQLRRGAVVVHVPDLLERPTRSVDRELHRAHDLDPVRIHLHPMIRVAGGGIPLDARVDLGAAGTRDVLALEHHHPGALAEHEAVASAVERARGRGRRVVVPGGHHSHPGEAEHHPRRDARVDAAREERVELAGPQQRHRVADRIGRARAPGREHVADPVQAEGNRDLARDHPHDRHRNRVGRHLLPAVGEELAILPLADLDAAGPAADEDPGPGLAPGAIPRRPRLPAPQSHPRATRASSAAGRLDPPRHPRDPLRRRRAHRRC